MDEAILFLSDSSEARGSVDRAVVADRDRVAGSLGAQSWSAICLDRAQLEAALADARWLRRGRNRLPVIARVDTPHAQRANEAFALGLAGIRARAACAHVSAGPP